MKYSRLAVLVCSLIMSLPDPRPVHFVEDCAGDRALSDAIYRSGYVVMARDILFTRAHNLLSTLGIVVALQTLRSLVKGGLYWAAPPCSSWVWLSRSSTGRTRLRPGGQRHRLKVRQANKLARRVCYICTYVRAKQAHFVIEQPASSVMPLYGPVRRLLRKHGAFEVSVPLGQYGSGSECRGSSACEHSIRAYVCVCASGSGLYFGPHARG